MKEMVRTSQLFVDNSRKTISKNISKKTLERLRMAKGYVAKQAIQMA